jgi:hypothetical protein
VSSSEIYFGHSQNLLHCSPAIRDICTDYEMMTFRTSVKKLCFNDLRLVDHLVVENTHTGCSERMGHIYSPVKPHASFETYKIFCYL